MFLHVGPEQDVERIAHNRDRAVAECVILSDVDQVDGRRPANVGLPSSCAVRTNPPTNGGGRCGLRCCICSIAQAPRSMPFSEIPSAVLSVDQSGWLLLAR
jgi:hypothetical protein